MANKTTISTSTAHTAIFFKDVLLGLSKRNLVWSIGFVGSVSVIQIRSYAQKKLFPSSENMTLAHVPPPRPKPNTEEADYRETKICSKDGDIESNRIYIIIANTKISLARSDTRSTEEGFLIHSNETN
ncbi:hypothetical protein YC2023_111925 [Brassica napus]